MEACIKLHELKELVIFRALDFYVGGPNPSYTSGGTREEEKVPQAKPAITDSVYDRWIGLPKCLINYLPKPLGQLIVISTTSTSSLPRGLKRRRKVFSLQE